MQQALDWFIGLIDSNICNGMEKANKFQLENIIAVFDWTAVSMIGWLNQSRAGTGVSLEASRRLMKYGRRGEGCNTRWQEK
jgi:hypothetical protein